MLVTQQASWNYRHREHTSTLPSNPLSNSTFTGFFILWTYRVRSADLHLHLMRFDRRKMINTKKEQHQLLLWSRLIIVSQFFSVSLALLNANAVFFVCVHIHTYCNSFRVTCKY